MMFKEYWQVFLEYTYAQKRWLMLMFLALTMVFLALPNTFALTVIAYIGIFLYVTHRFKKTRPKQFPVMMVACIVCSAIVWMISLVVPYKAAIVLVLIVGIFILERKYF